MKPRLDPRRLPAAAGMRNRFAAGDLTTAALIGQIVARVLT
jgi:hypothetical protein